MFHKLFGALTQTRSGILKAFQNLIGEGISDESLEALEEQLMTADMGVDMVESTIEVIRKNETKNFLEAVKAHLSQMLPEKFVPEQLFSPTVVLMVGVNGTGKTTTTAKVASLYQSLGQNVMLVAADTYRAAAIDQLNIWSNRVGCELVCNENTQEPSSVLFDGLNSAQSKKTDVVIVDTAGRLHTYDHLMAELEKMYRVVDKRFSMFKQKNLITMDASLGQNSLIQAREFGKKISLSGAVLTKVDGTAKGGIIFSLYSQLGVPVQYLGVGEGLDDLEPFDPGAYIRSLLGEVDDKE